MTENNIIYEALETLYDYLPRLIKGINDAVENFKMQREDKGIGLLIKIIDGLQWCTEVVYKTEEVLTTYGIEIDKEAINSIYNEVIEALENEDYVLISDLLEYEIVPILKEWFEGLDKMNQQSH